MVLHIATLKTVLDQVTSPATPLAALVTRGGRIIALSCYKDAPEDIERAHTAAAVASGVFLQERISGEDGSEPSSIDTVSELGCLRITSLPPLLLVLGGHPLLPPETLRLKATLCEDVLREPLSRLATR